MLDFGGLRRTVNYKISFYRYLRLTHPTQEFKLFFEEDLGKLLLNRKLLKIVVFNSEKQDIIQWID